MVGYKLIKSYLTRNKYSRPGRKIKKMKGIVIHWVANPKSTALANRNFFENRKYGKTGYGSAHEVIGLDGSIVLCVPPEEMTYNVGSKTYTKEALKKLGTYPNDCTYGIECTHLDWNGKMSDKTYNSLVERTADLCIEFDLVAGINGDVWLHKEVVGWKNCHRWFVNNPAEWHKFLEKVEKLRLEKLNIKVERMINVELEKWKQEMGEKSLDKLESKGIINDPEKWKKTLGEKVPQWLFWSIIDRISKGEK